MTESNADAALRMVLQKFEIRLEQAERVRRYDGLNIGINNLVNPRPALDKAEADLVLAIAHYHSTLDHGPCLVCEARNPFPTLE